MNAAIDDYIYSQSDNQQLILQKIHDFIMTFPEITSKIRYNIPFYYRKSWICYLNTLKNGGVELAFLRGNELSNDQGAMHFYGRKQVKGLRYSRHQEINFELIQNILLEALDLDDQVPYNVRKRKEK